MITRRTLCGFLGAYLPAQTPSANLPNSSPTKARKLKGGFVFTEGPVCNKQGDLYFSDVGEERIYCLSGGNLRVVRNSSNLANGLAFDRRGRLVVCERGRLTRTEPDGRITILAESYDGKGLHWPNDLTMLPDGSIYFTDLKQKSEWANPAKTGMNAVYRWSEQSGLSIFSRDCQEPNGIAFYPQGNQLYVSDTAGKCLKVYRVGDKGTQEGRVFAQTSQSGGPDGVKIDDLGNVWLCEDEGLVVFSPSGKRLMGVPIPETPSNCAFARTGTVLYVTARTSIYQLDVPHIFPKLV